MLSIQDRAICQVASRERSTPYAIAYSISMGNDHLAILVHEEMVMLSLVEQARAIVTQEEAR